jgi:hypothetical protein
VQEKFRQAGENLDSLNAWLDKVEREIGGQENMSDDQERLKSQISTVTVKIGNQFSRHSKNSSQHGKLD